MSPSALQYEIGMYTLLEEASSVGTSSFPVNHKFSSLLTQGDSYVGGPFITNTLKILTY